MMEQNPSVLERTLNQPVITLKLILKNTKLEKGIVGKTQKRFHQINLKGLAQKLA